MMIPLGKPLQPTPVIKLTEDVLDLLYDERVLVYKEVIKCLPPEGRGDCVGGNAKACRIFYAPSIGCEG